MKKNGFKNQRLRLSIGWTILLLLSVTLVGYSQTVGISPSGATTPNAAAGLDVNFTTKGLLIPRIALTGSTSFLPLTAHVAGMVVYNTASVSDVTPGLYYNNGSVWISVFPKTNTAGALLYWDGTTWKPVAAGTPGQRLQLVAGVPTWMP
jgi:hypothetical protein